MGVDEMGVDEMGSRRSGNKQTHNCKLYFKSESEKSFIFNQTKYI